MLYGNIGAVVVPYLWYNCPFILRNLWILRCLLIIPFWFLSVSIVLKLAFVRISIPHMRPV